MSPNHDVRAGDREYFAHSDPTGVAPGAPGARWQRLAHHLSGVASRAETFARAATHDPSFAAAARWAGLLHDLGKYSDAFQAMLRSAGTGGPHARVEHAGHGAAVALDAGAIDVAFAVAAHHAGLTAPRGGQSSLKERVDRVRTQASELLARARTELDLEGGPQRVPAQAPELDLRIRMLLSCLVDADRLDTAMEPDTALHLRPAEWLERLLRYVERRASRALIAEIRDARREVLESCITAGAWPERLLSLTVPTGGGKTLSSMAFALRRAAEDPTRVRRVIVVIPFLSIIEQNARVYVEALGEDYVVEHHSGDFARGREENELASGSALRHKLATENWDAPVVVTTSVRFFESLFSNRPSDLRRLHNLARSVVLLDEVQTFPRGLLHPVESMLGALARDWGTTFVFCTATQPALERAEPSQQRDRRWQPGTLREIVPDPQSLFRRFRRVALHWPEAGCRLSWEHLARQLAGEPRVLCVVNLRAHAARLFGLLRDLRLAGVRHLSTTMCPRHRLNVLAWIRDDLHAGRECRVVSTQLVEAGVDLDFPVVYRAMGPLDSVAQAAGRCDREGTLTAARGAPGGTVVVFEPETDGKPSTPPGAYREATDITRSIAGDSLAIDEPAQVRAYFDRYYDCDQDVNDIEGLRRRLDFAEVADRFTMIADRTRAVLVPYGEGEGLIGRLADRSDWDRPLARLLQGYQVGLYDCDFDHARSAGAVYEVAPEIDVWATTPAHYDQDLGFRMEAAEQVYVI